MNYSEDVANILNELDNIDLYDLEYDVPVSLFNEIKEALEDIEDNLGNLPKSLDNLELNIKNLRLLNTDDLYSNSVHSYHIANFIELAETLISNYDEGQN